MGTSIGGPLLALKFFLSGFMSVSSFHEKFGRPPNEVWLSNAGWVVIISLAGLIWSSIRIAATSRGNKVALGIRLILGGLFLSGAVFFSGAYVAIFR